MGPPSPPSQTWGCIILSASSRKAVIHRPKSDPDSPSDMLAHQLQALELMPARGDVSSGVREPLMGSYFGMGLLMRKQEPLDLRRHP